MKAFATFCFLVGVCVVKAQDSTITSTRPPLPESVWQQQFQVAVQSVQGVAPTGLLPDSEWQQQFQVAVQGATERFQINFVTVLAGLANTTRDAGQNVTIALATLTRAVVTNTFDLGTVVSYMPRLLLMDLPTQFVEVLKLIRSNQIPPRPNDVNGAIDTLLIMTRQAEQSGITGKIFDPIIRFLPNMMHGLQDFVQQIVGTASNVFGAGMYRYDAEVDNDIVSRLY